MDIPGCLGRCLKVVRITEWALSRDACRIDVMMIYIDSSPRKQTFIQTPGGFP
ncbi:hypothetical protein JOE11_003064 [Robbsia andropogonis]